jgi:hypothetical protein
MALKQRTAFLLAIAGMQAQTRLASPQSSDLAVLREPDYFVRREAGMWMVRKPRLRVLLSGDGVSPGSWLVFQSENRAAVEERRRVLPRLRLSRPLVQFNPVSRRRTLLEDWTRQEDAQEAEADIQAIVNAFARDPAQALFASTPVYLASLNGASGHTAEDSGEHTRYVVYLDPFRATGRLHAASTLVHELSHVDCYRKRGFHANRAAAVLPREDFVLLGSADELAAYEAEAALIESFLNSMPGRDAPALRKAMLSVDLRWPPALTLLLGVEAPNNVAERFHEAREQIVLDVQRQAQRYWDLHHRDRLDTGLEGTIRSWYSESPEWRDIAGQRANWVRAGADVRQRAASAGVSR